MNDLISIIINVYNGEEFIKKCLESVINQTYKKLEILIINDGSTDDTLKICEQYKDDRIRIITTENMGLSLSRNIGLDNAKGNYYYFVDADDFIEKDTIEYLYNLIKTSNYKIATCKSLDIYDYNYEYENPEEQFKIISSKEMLCKILLSEDRAGTIWNKLIKKDLFEGIRFQNRIINDVVVTYKLVLRCDEIVYGSQIKYLYLRHQKSATGLKEDERSIDLFKATIERYDDIKKYYPDFIENEIGLLLIIMMLYCYSGEKLQSFLTEQKALQKAKELYGWKMIFSNIKIKEKIKILLFRVNPNLYKKIEIKYVNKNYQYKL